MLIGGRLERASKGNEPHDCGVHGNEMAILSTAIGEANDAKISQERNAQSVRQGSRPLVQGEGKK